VEVEAKLREHSLKDVLAVIDKVIGGDITLPQLNLIKVSCFPGYVQFQATNLESYLTIQVPAETLKEGEVCVYANGFLRCVMREGIRVFTKNGHLVVQSGEVESGIALLSVEEFTNFPTPTYQSTLPTKLLLFAIEKVGFAIAKHKDAMGYGYLSVGGEGDTVYFVGADGYRFAIFRAKASFEDRIKLPYSSLEVLKELLEKEEKETIKVGKEKSFVFLAGTNTGLEGKILGLSRLQGNYP
jgi:DNA polymerase III sliding clamp (beta) subunit (PCNA family)